MNNPFTVIIEYTPSGESPFDSGKEYYVAMLPHADGGKDAAVRATKELKRAVYDARDLHITHVLNVDVTGKIFFGWQLPNKLEYPS